MINNPEKEKTISPEVKPEWLRWTRSFTQEEYIEGISEVYRLELSDLEELKYILQESGCIPAHRRAALSRISQLLADRQLKELLINTLRTDLTDQDLSRIARYKLADLTYHPNPVRIRDRVVRRAA